MITREHRRALRDPLGFQRALWPSVKFYDRQKEVIYAVRDCPEVFCVAGNMLGKDFLAGYVAVSFLLHPQMYFPRDYVREVESRRDRLTNPNPHTVRIVTTSVKDDHLRVLWGEIGRFLDNANPYTPLGPVREKDGGPLVVNHRDVRKKVNGRPCPISYLRGMVSERGEGMAGHHAAYTLVIGDEASGLASLVYTQAATWAKRALYIGNPNPCVEFFKECVKAGNLIAKPYEVTT